jgi:DNA-damage-inducible protein D
MPENNFPSEDKFPSEDNYPSSSPFDAIRKIDDSGNEYWSARDLYELFGYSTWQRFQNVMEQAKINCEHSGQAVSDHFNINVKIVEAGISKKPKEDYKLSRYACYLTALNADATKKIVADAKTYFTVQARRQELADEVAKLPENKRRIRYREDLKRLNTGLQDAARDAGVISRKEFSEFQDEGYKGLYDGETENDIHERKGLEPKEKILDYMESEELGANIFRVTQTEAKIRRENIRDRQDANETHHKMGKSVRHFIDEQEGTMPEDLPTPEKSYQQLKKEDGKEKQRQELLKRQPMLPLEFDEDKEG